MHDDSVESILVQQEVAHLFQRVRCDLANKVYNKADIEAVRTKWLRYFLPLNIECAIDDNVKVSVSDIGFVGMCHAWIQSCTKIPHVDDIFSTNAELVILSCQHTHESRQYWPNQRSLLDLRQRVANIVVHFFDRGTHERIELIRAFVECKGALCPDAARMFASRKTPDGMKDASDVSEEASGLLWQTSASLINNYVRFASRIFYKIERDNDTVGAYSPPGCNIAPRLNCATRLRLEEWVVTRCRVEQTEDMSKLFRDTANTSWCPMSTETHRFRNRETKTDMTSPLQLLESEVGVSIGQHMHDRSLTRLHEVAADPEGLFWDALLVSLLGWAIFQSTRMDWCARYVCAEGHSRDTLRKIRDTSDDALKRPLIVHLQRRWHVLHRQRLLPCHDLSHAILSWMYILRECFHNVTEEGEDLSDIVDSFINNQSVQL